MSQYEFQGQHAQGTAQVPPGWYPDPVGNGGERYWDGIAWSQEFTRAVQPAPALQHPVAASQQSVAKTKTRTWLVVAGWVGAFLIPLIGLIVSVTLIARDDARGKWMLGVTVLMTIFLVSVKPYQ